MKKGQKHPGRPGRKKGERKPTERALKFAEYVASGVPRNEAVVLAGYSPKNPSQSAAQAMHQLSLSFPQLMDKCGLTDEGMIKKHLLRFLAAKRVQYFAYKGKVKSKRIVEALDIQLAAFELACKLKGSFAPVRTESHSRAITTIILDVPRPPRPGPNGEMPPTTIEVQPSSNGHKPQKPE